MSVFDLSAWDPSPETLQLISRHLAELLCVFPLRLRGQVLEIAISDPIDFETLDSISYLSGVAVEPVLAPRHAINEAIVKYYRGYQSGSNSRSYSPKVSVAAIDQYKDTGINIDERNNFESEAAPINRYVDWLISEAIKRRVSDIHLEPLEKRFRVRLRIDGVLREIESPPKRLQLSIIAHLKIMAKISIAEKRVPQDGRIQFKRGSKKIDLRVSTIPTTNGESMVMRVLDGERQSLDLSELGLFSDDREILEGLITKSDGLILLTGPTGSGKTTTLYSCLHFINHPDRKIITIEDPVEYQLKGVNQVQVASQTGISFSTALRAILQQSPDIIMIGEIRDMETAEIAINASLTGHLVFSTLHTNDAPSAISRLLDFGIKPFLVSASLHGVVAQRLVRLNCEECKAQYQPTDAELSMLELMERRIPSAVFMKGTGCTHCHGIGYYGRSGIFEIMVVDEAIQQMIYEQATIADLRHKALACGMRAMREDGKGKVRAGITTFEEVLSATVVNDT